MPGPLLAYFLLRDIEVVLRAPYFQVLFECGLYPVLGILGVRQDYGKSSSFSIFNSATGLPQISCRPWSASR